MTGLITDNDKSRHDFKNQLAIIRGFAEILLADSAAGDPRRRDFAEIHRAAVTALDLLARLYPDGAVNPIASEMAGHGDYPDR